MNIAAMNRVRADPPTSGDERLVLRALSDARSRAITAPGAGRPRRRSPTGQHQRPHCGHVIALPSIGSRVNVRCRLSVRARRRR